MSGVTPDPFPSGMKAWCLRRTRSCHPIWGQPSGQECALVRTEKTPPLHREELAAPLGCPQPPAEEPTKWHLRKQFTCLQDLAHTESTNEALPIGLSQAKFPGTAGHPGARDLLESPSEQHMSSVAFLLFCIYRQAWPPLPSDWSADLMDLFFFPI